MEGLALLEPGLIILAAIEVRRVGPAKLNALDLIGVAMAELAREAAFSSRCRSLAAAVRACLNSLIRLFDAPVLRKFSSILCSSSNPTVRNRLDMEKMEWLTFRQLALLQHPNQGWLVKHKYAFRHNKLMA